MILFVGAVAAFMCGLFACWAIKERSAFFSAMAMLTLYAAVLALAEIGGAA